MYVCENLCYLLLVPITSLGFLHKPPPSALRGGKIWVNSWLNLYQTHTREHTGVTFHGKNPAIMGWHWCQIPIERMNITWCITKSSDTRHVSPTSSSSSTSSTTTTTSLEQQHHHRNTLHLFPNVFVRPVPDPYNDITSHIYIDPSPVAAYGPLFSGRRRSPQEGCRYAAVTPGQVSLVEEDPLFVKHPPYEGVCVYVCLCHILTRHALVCVCEGYFFTLYLSIQGTHIAEKHVRFFPALQLSLHQGVCSWMCVRFFFLVSLPHVVKNSRITHRIPSRDVVKRARDWVGFVCVCLFLP